MVAWVLASLLPASEIEVVRALATPTCGVTTLLGSSTRAMFGVRGLFGSMLFSGV